MALLSLLARRLPYNSLHDQWQFSFQFKAIKNLTFRLTFLLIHSNDPMTKWTFLMQSMTSECHLISPLLFMQSFGFQRVCVLKNWTPKEKYVQFDRSKFCIRYGISHVLSSASVKNRETKWQYKCALDVPMQIFWILCNVSNTQQIFFQDLLFRFRFISF